MDFNTARYNMIEQQIRTWEVLDRTVLDVMSRIPRELFVPDAYRSLAYSDIEVPLAHKQAMLFPKIDGRMLQELTLGINDHCLEIGTGSGYSAACMAHIAASVHSVDIQPDFCEQATERMDKLHLNNVTFQAADALADDVFNKQYDVIAVTASLPIYDSRFERLLNDGGRMFMVIGKAPAMQAILVQRQGDDIEHTTLFETQLQAMMGFKAAPSFVF